MKKYYWFFDNNKWLSLVSSHVFVVDKETMDSPENKVTIKVFIWNFWVEENLT